MILPRRLAATLLILACLMSAACSDEGQREAARWAAERVGEVALATATERASEGGDRAADFIDTPVAVREIANGVFQATGVGNVQWIATSEGHVVFDTGLVLQAGKQRRLLAEAVPEGPVTHVILSHSHQDHVGGTPFYVEDGTVIVAHEEFEEEQRYLTELGPYLHDRNRALFPWLPESLPDLGPLNYGGIEVDVTVDEPEALTFEQGGLTFEVLPAPGAEGSDNVLLWLPEQKILFSGDFFGPLFPQFPNVFTMRGEKVRKPVEYIESLDRVIALGPEMIVPSHKDPIEGAEQIRADLVRMRDAVRYVHDRTVEGMNAGKTVEDLMAEIALPPELALSEAHGRVIWAVRSIWEYYATWFHFERTTDLYAVPQSAVHEEFVTLAGADALVDAADAHLRDGRALHALHLLEVLENGAPTHARAAETRIRALDALEAEVAAFRNSYELDWIAAQRRKAEAVLASSEG